MALKSGFRITLKGVLLILLNVVPLSGYMVDTGQCECMPYSKPCNKEAVLISVASAFSNRVLACLPGMRLCCDERPSLGGRSERIGLTDHIRGFVLQMPHLLRRNRTKAQNFGKGAKSRSESNAYNPLFDAEKIKNSQESEHNNSTGTSSPEVMEDRKPLNFTTGMDKNPDDKNDKEGSEVFKNSILETRQLTHGETPEPKTENVNQMLNTRAVVENQEEPIIACGESGKCHMVDVNSTSNENISNTVAETLGTVSSSNSGSENGITTLTTLSLTTLLETGSVLGKQRIDKTEETTQTVMVGEVNTVAVTSVLSAATPYESWAPVEEAATNNTTATNTVEEVGVSSLVMSENKDTELHSSYDIEHPVTRISDAVTNSNPVSLLIDLKSSEFSSSVSEVLDSNHLNYSTLTSGREATPVNEISEATGFVQVIPFSKVPVALISNKDNETTMMNPTYISPNITQDHHPVLFEAHSTSSIEHMTLVSVEYNEQRSPTVELLATGVQGSVTPLKDFGTRQSTQLESSLQAVSTPGANFNDLGVLSSPTMLESSSQAGDGGKPTGLTNDIILVEMASFASGKDTNNSRRMTTLAGKIGDTDLISRTGKSLNLEKTLPPNSSPSTYSADGANTFAPEAYSKGSKELPVEFRNFLLPNTELAITESNIKYTTTKTYYIIMRPAKSSLVPTTMEKVSATIKTNSAHFTSIPHTSQGSVRLYQPTFIKPSPDSQEKFNDYLESVRKESSESNPGKNSFFNWIFG